MSSDFSINDKVQSLVKERVMELIRLREDKKREIIYNAACDKGVTDPYDINDRLSIDEYVGGDEVYRLDGEPLVMLLAPKPSMISAKKDGDGNHSIVFDLEYRIL